MFRSLLVASALVTISLWSQLASAVCHGPWQELKGTGHEIIRPRNLILIGASALPPLLLAPTGGDYALRRLAQDDLGGSYNPEPVSVVAPYVVAGATTAVYLGGLIAGECEIQRTTSAMMQGMVTTVLTVGLTKWVTGRQWPNGGRDPYAADRLEHAEDAQNFRPFQRGLNAAFPSGHTALMFAAAAAFRASTPQAGWFRYAGYPFAIAVGAGMWLGDHHWASDILSGAMLGEALGAASGNAFRGAEADPVTAVLLPLPSGAALMLSGTL
jgi:membrane-associated phospholipid phosphatase